MPIHPRDTIIGRQRGSAAAAVAFAQAVGSERLDQVEAYVGEVFALAPRIGIDPAIVVSQSALETNNWRDDHWRGKLNPAGMGVTDAFNFGHGWASGADAARGQIVHLWLYARGVPLPDALAPHAHLDPRRDAIPPAQLGQAPTLESLGGKWASEDEYGQRIANRSRDIFPDLPDQTDNAQESPMAMNTHQFVGLDQDVLLPDDIEVIIDIVPDSKIGWVRSGVPETGQTSTTFHDTGTSGSTAKAQRNYLHNGPTYRDKETGEIKRRLVGFNFAVDDQQIIQLTPLNEATWAAGTANGNKTSWHVEQCFGGKIDFDRSLRNAIALHAGLIAARGWSTDTALVQHHHWYGKSCPGQIRNKGIWTSVQRQVGDGVRAILGNLGSTLSVADPEPIPELAPFHNGELESPPAMVRAAGGLTFFYVTDRVKAIRPTPRLQRGNPDSKRVGPDVQVDEEFDVTWIYQSTADNELYYVTPFYTRIKVADTVRIGDRTGPAPDPMVAPDEMETIDTLLPPIGIDARMATPEEPGVEARMATPADEDEEAPGH